MCVVCTYRVFFVVVVHILTSRTCLGGVPPSLVDHYQSSLQATLSLAVGYGLCLALRTTLISKSVERLDIDFCHVRLFSGRGD